MASHHKTALAALILLTSCDPSGVANNVHYARDIRTDLCFAMYNLGSNANMMTHVPCTPSVLHMVQKEEQSRK